MDAECCSFCGKEGLSFFNCEKCKKTRWYCSEHRLQKCWCQLESKESDLTRETAKTVTSPQVTHLHVRRHSINISNLLAYPQMYLDMNRDGEIDENPAENIWTWGKEGKGAIIPCNVDPEIKDRVLAPILFTASISCEGKLRIKNERDKERIRIFAGPNCSDKQILGALIKDSEVKFEIPGKVVFGIEATRYDQTEEDKEIELEFVPIVLKEELKEKIQIAKVRVTPWIMLHHFNTPKEIFYSELQADTKEKELFLSEVKKLLEKSKAELLKLEKELTQVNELIENKKIMSNWESAVKELSKEEKAKFQNRQLIVQLEKKISELGKPLKISEKLTDEIIKTSSLIIGLNTTMRSVPPNSEFIQMLTKYAGGIKITKIPAKSQFMQDGMEIGCSYFPNLKDSFYAYPVAFRAPIYLWDDSITRKNLKLPIFTLGEFVASDRDLKKDLMSCGNLEVTPPLKDYPFGRIYYSDKLKVFSENKWIDKEFDPKVAEFLKIQKLQKPFVLDASWLEVGHVDEVISFLPKKHEGKLVAFIPSPKKAYELLCQTAIVDPEARMEFRHAEEIEIHYASEKEKVRYSVPIALNIWKFLIAGHPKLDTASLLWKNLFGGEISKNANLNGLKVNYPYLMNNFSQVFEATIKPEMNQRFSQLKWLLTPNPKRETDCYQYYLDDVKKTLEKELGEVLIVEIPVIFYPILKPGGRAAPLTENMVNMLVLSDKCIFPKPGGPVASQDIALKELKISKGQDVFEQYMLFQLNNFGLTGLAIDDFLVYQSHGGNVHCGTNTLREPDLEGIKWWETKPKDI